MLTLTMNPSLDVSSGTHVLVPATKLRCETPIRAAGGGGVNVARVANRLGRPTTAVLPLGGPNGAELLDLLDHEHIPTIAVPIAGGTRQSVSIAERDHDRQFRFVFPGPELNAAEADAVRRALIDQIPVHAGGEGERPVIVISGSLPPGLDEDFLADLADDLSDHGAFVVGDGSGRPLRALSRARVALLKPSERELGTLVGSTLESPGQVEAAARSIVDDHPCNAVLVSLGPNGAVLVERDEPTRWLHPPDVDVVSTVGAGDSMVAATAIALSVGATMVEAATRGVAAGTAAVLTPGSELCRAEDVARLTPMIRLR